MKAFINGVKEGNIDIIFRNIENLINQDKLL